MASPDTITPSETVLLHGATFAKSAGFGGRPLVLGEGKVDRTELVFAAWLAAAVTVLRADAMTATAVQTKAMFGLLKGSELRFARGTGPMDPWPEGSLEWALVQAVSGAPEPVSAQKVFAALMEEDTQDPAGQGLQIVERALAFRELMGVREKSALKIFKSVEFHATDATHDAADRAPATPVKAMLDEFAAGEPELWQRLRDAMDGALKFRVKSD